MIGGDASSLKPSTNANQRLELQRTQVEQLDAFIWPQTHSLWEIMRATRRTRYDVVTVQDPFWRGLIACLVVRKARLNVQLHTELVHQSWFRRFMAVWVLRRADSARVVSERIRREVIAIRPNLPVTVLPVYIDVTRFAGVQHRAHSRFAKTLLWIGRFEAEKDPLAAIDVLDAVRRKGVDAGLAFLGSGSLESSLRAKVKERGLHDHVEFAPWQDPVAYLGMADLLLNTSLYEGYGAVIVEALAAGVPVVAPDVGVAKEAGAVVAPRAQLGDTAAKVLQSGERGTLRLTLPSEEEWARAWKASL